MYRSLRGDDSQENIARDAADAYEQALQFFKKNASVHSLQHSLLQ